VVEETIEREGSDFAIRNADEILRSAQAARDF
jgi:hypothetical protein